MFLIVEYFVDVQLFRHFFKCFFLYSICQTLIIILDIWLSHFLSQIETDFLISLPLCMTTYHAGLKWLEHLCLKAIKYQGGKQGSIQIIKLMICRPELELTCTRTTINCRKKSVKSQHNKLMNTERDVLIPFAILQTVRPFFPPETYPKHQLTPPATNSKTLFAGFR